MVLEHKRTRKMHLHPCISCYRPHVHLQPLLCILELPLLVSTSSATCPSAASLGIGLTCGLAEQGPMASFFDVTWQNCAGVNLLFLIFWCCRAQSYSTLEIATALRAFSWASTKRTMRD